MGRLYHPKKPYAWGKQTGSATTRGSCLTAAKKASFQGRSGQAPLLLTRGNLWLSKKPFHSLGPTPQSFATSWLWTVSSAATTAIVVSRRAAARGFPHLPFLCFTPASCSQIFTCSLGLHKSDSYNSWFGPAKLFILVSFCHKEKGHGTYIPSWKKELS